MYWGKRRGAWDWTLMNAYHASEERSERWGNRGWGHCPSGVKCVVGRDRCLHTWHSVPLDTKVKVNAVSCLSVAGSSLLRNICSHCCSVTCWTLLCTYPSHVEKWCQAHSRHLINTCSVHGILNSPSSHANSSGWPPLGFVCTTSNMLWGISVYVDFPGLYQNHL